MQTKGSVEDPGMDIRWDKLVSLRGRIGRRTFWILAGPLLLIAFLIAWFRVLYSPSAGEVYDTVFFFGFAFSLIVALFGVRRMHDHGRSGRWLILLVAPFPLAYIPFLFPLLLLHPIATLVLMVIIGLRPGSPDVNRYGPPGSGSPFPDEQESGMAGTRTPQRADQR
jgi:uncharacterized membrane protein YhaH (DUF805 family)